MAIGNVYRLNRRQLIIEQPLKLYLICEIIIHLQYIFGFCILSDCRGLALMRPFAHQWVSHSHAFVPDKDEN